MADATGLDPNADFALRRLSDCALYPFEFTRLCDLKSSIRLLRVGANRGIGLSSHSFMARGKASAVPLGARENRKRRSCEFRSLDDQASGDTSLEPASVQLTRQGESHSSRQEGNTGRTRIQL
jgi:hypothetical protein